MVGFHVDQVFSTEEQRASTFEAKDNSSEFFIMGVIVALGREETARVESNGMYAILMLLGYYNS